MRSFDFIAPRLDPKKLFSRSSFRPIVDPKDIDWGIPYFPAKYFFFDKKEVLFEFKNSKLSTPKIDLRPRVFFGLRRCDLNSIKNQDIVFNYI